jgi:hypothetical protein
MGSGAEGNVPRGARFAAGLPAVLHLPKNDYDCTAHNLSRTGTLLSGRFPRLIGYRVEVSFRQPNGGLTVRLPGQVVRARREKDGVQKIALEFMELSDERRGVLEVLVARLVEGHAPAALEALRPGMAPAEVRAVLEQVPVPHRIAMAFRAPPREREFLKFDTHPQVLEALARNPSLRPAEARELAAVPLLQPSTLELLARDPRWTSDEAIKLAVVSHPRAPLTLARRIVDGLSPATVKKLLARPGVPPSIRTQLQRRPRG